jgi:hypothetical protein
VVTVEDGNSVALGRVNNRGIIMITSSLTRDCFVEIKNTFLFGRVLSVGVVFLKCLNTQAAPPSILKTKLTRVSQPCVARAGGMSRVPNVYED